MSTKQTRNPRLAITLPPVLRGNTEELLRRMSRKISNVVEDLLRAMIREKGLDPDLPLEAFMRQLDEKGYRDAKSPPAHSKHRAA